MSVEKTRDSAPGTLPSKAMDEHARKAGARPWGLLAEFAEVEDLKTAAREVRDAGFRRWDAHTPFPVHGLNDAMGLRSTRLPLVVLGSAITGAALALLMQWWMNAVDYPFIISGKPFFSLPSSIPVFFEVTILFSALTAFLGMLAFNGLPQHHHPLFRSDRFRRVTQDRFFITIEARDPSFEEDRVREFLECLGSVHVERIEE